jgi:hypothetical protein
VSHKAEVIEALREGSLSFEEACTRYGLTTDEIVSWRRAYGCHGLNGLKAMKVQMYRAQNDKSAGRMEAPTI